jgi:hypothetical protein
MKLLPFCVNGAITNIYITFPIRAVLYICYVIVICTHVLGLFAMQSVPNPYGLDGNGFVSSMIGSLTTFYDRESNTCRSHLSLVLHVSQLNIDETFQRNLTHYKLRICTNL